tara:strand:- start:1379 stop:1567 length:189 start_codon:yes stop_codon:yes gene_type:complete
MAKFKRGDVVRHQTFTNEIGVVTEVKRLDVGKTKMVISYGVWWSDQSLTHEPARDIKLVENK